MNKDYIIGIALGVCVGLCVLAITYTVWADRNLPCSTFENVKIQSIPARCLKEFQQPNVSIIRGDL